MNASVGLAPVGASNCKATGTRTKTHAPRRACSERRHDFGGCRSWLPTGTDPAEIMRSSATHQIYSLPASFSHVQLGRSLGLARCKVWRFILPSSPTVKCVEVGTAGVGARGQSTPTGNDSQYRDSRNILCIPGFAVCIRSASPCQGTLSPENSRLTNH
jgi:hypothetical protein